MPALVVPNTIQVSTIWTLNGTDHAVNVYNYLVPTGLVVDQAQVNSIAGSVTNAYNTGTASYRAGVSSKFALSRISVRDIRVANQLPLESSINQAGTNTAEPLPAQVSLVATLRTALAGRRHRGRTYLMGWAEGSNDANGKATQGTADRALNYMGAMKAFTANGNLLLLGVTSRVNLETQQVTNIVVRDLTWDTQRRRSYSGI